MVFLLTLTKQFHFQVFKKSEVFVISILQFVVGNYVVRILFDCFDI